MKQNFTLPEMQTALRMAGAIPAPTSPLAGVKPAAEFDPVIMQTLRQKGICDGAGSLQADWRRALLTLADPSQQASAYIEGVGTARYFASAEGIAVLAPTNDGQQRVLGGLSVDSILAEIDDLLAWRTVPDGPPLRVELSIEELTTVAALADACREEQLQAMIERRTADTKRVSRDDAERQIQTGRAKLDGRWLVSILSRFAPLGCSPNPAALDAGAAALISRRWARTGTGYLEVGPDLEALCAGFANVTPFLALGVGPPWVEPEVVVLTRGLQSFWGIEFRTGSGKNWASVSRVGARAMEELLRRHLASLAPPVTEPLRPWPQPARTERKPQPVSQPATSEPPKPKVTPPPDLSPPLCAKCNKPLKPGRKFCTACGAPVA